MQAPRMEGVAVVFLAGIVFLGLGWFLAPSLLTFIIAFVVFDLSLAVSKLVAVWTLALWVFGHVAFWLYIQIHDRLIAKAHARKHADFMRMRDVFYYPGALCFENYESLKKRERNWLDGGKPGCNVPDSPLRCEGELRDEVGSWLEAGRDK